MNRGVLLLLIGVLLILASLLADTLGFGTGSGMGWKQITGAIVGLILVIVGVRSRSSGGSGDAAV